MNIQLRFNHVVLENGLMKLSGNQLSNLLERKCIISSFSLEQITGVKTLSQLIRGLQEKEKINDN